MQLQDALEQEVENQIEIAEKHTPAAPEAQLDVIVPGAVEDAMPKVDGEFHVEEAMGIADRIARRKLN